MQSTTGGGSGSCSGGLARFRSAPAAWLESLLEEEEEDDEDPLNKPNHCFTQLLTAGNDGFYSSTSTSPSYAAAAINSEISPTPKFSHHGGLLKREESGVSSLIDMEMEKLLEDSVPCRVRAKRGCATHPRSIAERVRRTKISDRIRKLQEVVPNMDKQTNTADMLEEAVEYVKFLQKQIQDLTDHQHRCKCMVKE